MATPFHLHGKTILVTGASSGIGQSVAVECSRMGATVVITGRDRERLLQTMAMMEGEDHALVTADLSHFEEIERLANDCPKLDGVSHNAGIANMVTVKHITADRLGLMMGTNALAPILLTQQLLSRKRLNKNSSIVFTSSLSGIYCVHYGESIYAASKGAVGGFAKGAALELAAQGIRVNCVNPSIIRTPLFENEGGALSEEQMQEKIANYPLRRLGEPTDVSWAHVFLLSDASSWITGIDLPVDGGYLLI